MNIATFRNGEAGLAVGLVIGGALTYVAGAEQARARAARTQPARWGRQRGTSFHCCWRREVETPEIIKTALDPRPWIGGLCSNAPVQGPSSLRSLNTDGAR